MLEAQRPSYEGLNGVSTLLWRDFLGLYEDKFQKFSYNVTVGRGIAPRRGLSDAEAALWKRLTQKRIDVVAVTATQTWIIELEERPGARTLGQLRLYTHLYPLSYTLVGTLVSALVCRYLGFDMFATFRKQGDIIFKFPYGKPPSLPDSFVPTTRTVPFDLITEHNA